MFVESRFADVLHHRVTLVEAQDHGVGQGRGCSSPLAAATKTTPIVLSLNRFIFLAVEIQFIPLIKGRQRT